VIDWLFTTDAAPISARENPAESRSLRNFAGDVGGIHIDEEIGERVLFNIVDLAGQLTVGFCCSSC